MKLLLSFLLAVSAGPAWAHGEAKLGKVHFKVECNATAQAQFNLAMAYYHSFAWSQMQEPLEGVLKADPACGMAHWARALASLNNPFAWPTVIPPAALAEGPRILAEAERAGLKSKRERDYVEALGVFFAEPDKLDHRARARALESALEQVMLRYKRDQEAATLYALVLSANFDAADKKYTNQLKAAKILEKVFLDQPDHPGAAHYLIHSYDYPPIARKGMDAARRYSRIAPDAPHALHMPSHIFTRVGAWRESIQSNRASAKAAGDKGFDKWHAFDYMVYAYLQLGEYQTAREVVDEAFGNPARIDHPATAYAYAAMPARLVLERAAWKDATALELLPDFPWAKYTFAEAVNAYARGIGAAMSGDPSQARIQAERLARLGEATGVAYWKEQVAIQADVVNALVLVAEGDDKGGLAALRAAAKREDASEKHVVTPGPILPARELLAYVMLDKGDARGALREFEAVLAKEPNRLRALNGAIQAAERSGNRKKAKEYSAKLPGH
jgi:hypothetical protein